MLAASVDHLIATVVVVLGLGETSLVAVSGARLDDLLDLGQLFKAFGNN